MFDNDQTIILNIVSISAPKKYFCIQKASTGFDM